MLIQLEIKNFAIIEHSIINFENGFNAITGETGAGKSILLDALSCIIGGRSTKNIVRKGEEQAEVTAVFLKTGNLKKRLSEKNIDVNDDVVIVKRIISSNGRSISKINGSIQTLNTIKDVCLDIVEMCGQKAHIELLQEDKYLQMVDDYADYEHKGLLSSYKEQYKSYVELNKKLDELSNKEREQEQLLDMYRFQIEEIEKMELEPGEDEKLEEEEKFLVGFEKISQNVSFSIGALESIDNIYEAKEFLKNASKFDENLGEIAERIEKAYYELEDAKNDVESYLNNVDYDEERLNFIVSRLEGIKQLKRKYGDTIDDILSHYEMISDKLEEFDNKEELINNLKKEIYSLEKELISIANTLHESRVRYAEKMSSLILKELKELCMPDAKIIFKVNQVEELTENGLSEAQILFNANKGEDLEPLSKIASGGELSRVLLAMKVALNSSEEVDTIIFDEVDEGIGGEVGRVIGKKLYEIGQQVQVIVISHLPQVAAKANHHFLIEKGIKDERTVSTVTKLSEFERVDEIGRMIFGEEVTEITLQQAREMLKK